MKLCFLLGFFFTTFVEGIIFIFKGIRIKNIFGGNRYFDNFEVAPLSNYGHGLRFYNTWNVIRAENTCYSLTSVHISNKNHILFSQNVSDRNG